MDIDSQKSVWVGQVYEVPIERDTQLSLVPLIPGLKKNERYFLNGMLSLCLANNQRKTDQKKLSEYLKENNRKNSAYNTIKVYALRLYKLGLFDRYEEVRFRTRPTVIFKLKDIAEIIELESMRIREKENTPEKEIKRGTHTEILKDDILIEGNEHFKHAYSRKINHVILRRCSSDPKNLGKKISLYLPGYQETIQVIQRTASGIPPMNGSEDRLQQALLTMFAEHINKKGVEGITNSWLLDMRQVCRTMKKNPSSGNIIIQSKKLYQLRYNTFEFHFKPNSEAATKLNLSPSPQQKLKELYRDEGEMFELNSEHMDQYFLSKLEAVRDKVIYSDKQEILPLENTNETQEKEEVFSPESHLYDHTGKLYRFYRVSFHDSVFRECLDMSLGQIHKQPPSLLEEDSVTARGLVYLAQRILGKSRNHPFESNWGDVATEIQPLKSATLVHRAMERVFEQSYIKEHSQAWSPDPSMPVNLHGYCFQTEIPPRFSRRKSMWTLRIWRDKNHGYTGNDGPAAQARIRAIKQNILN